MKKICVCIIVLVIVIGCTILCLNLGKKSTEDLKNSSQMCEETVLLASTSQVSEASSYIDIEETETKEFKNFAIGTAVVSGLLLISFVYEIKA